MTILDIFDKINKAVERNDRELLHEQFVALMILQDQLARSENCGEHVHTIVHGTMREDGINWPINECTTCDWWK